MTEEERLAGQEYLRWGWVPLPTGYQKKYPMLKWEPFQQGKPITEQMVDAWWGTDRPKGIWVMCGPRSNLIVADLDGLDTARWLRSLLDGTGLDFKTIPRVKSSKGWHLYFAWADGTQQWHYDGPTSVGLAVNIDVRNGDSGGVVAPPSVHQSGHKYVWEVRPQIDAATGRPLLPALPPALHSRVAAGVAEGHGDRTGASQHTRPAFTAPPEAGGRNVWLAQQAGHLAKKFRADRTSYDTMFDLLAQQVPGLSTEEVAKLRESIWSKEARKPEEEVAPPPEQIPQLAGPDEPVKVARQLVRQHWMVQTTDGNRPLLRRWREDWYRWTGAHWGGLSDATVRSQLYHQLEHATYQAQNNKGEWEVRRWLPTSAKVSNVQDALRAVVHLDDTHEPPAWTGNGAHPAGTTFVPLANGLLTYPGRKLLDHHPDYFNVVSSPFSYEQSATKPREWLRFLDQLWPDDDAAALLLQEWFGLMLTSETRYQKILLLVGPQRAGKGTIVRVLTQLVGAGNVASPTASSFAQNFGMMSLIGKTMAVIPDARISGRDAQVLVERLLSISGEDELDVDRKNKAPWHGKLGCRLVIVSNELPRIADAGTALANRYLPVRFNRSWLGREDLDLTERLLAEMPGILNWALDGLDRLVDRKRFVLAESAQREIDELETLGSPVLAFVQDWCQVGPGWSVPVDRLYAKWATWCAQNGHRVTPKNVFSKDLTAAVPSIRRERPRSGVGREYVFGGIGLTRDGEGAYTPPTPTQTSLS